MSSGIRVVLQSRSKCQTVALQYTVQCQSVEQGYTYSALLILYHLIFLSACQGLCISIVFSNYFGAPLNPSTNVYTD